MAKNIKFIFFDGEKMEEAFIKIENVSFVYDDNGETNNFAVKNVSLEIKEGEFVAVLGHNGSGKSTLAKLINMIYTPASGKIYIKGKDITDENMSDEDVMELRKTVGMVFQNPDNQLVATIVEDDVAFGPENLGVPTEEIRKRVDSALADVGMTKYALHEPHRLSGGQKQRIAIAGIIAMLPECIIFDESTAMLDPVGRKEVMDSIIKLNREKNITVILITHYMEEAAMADRVVVIDDGRIISDGSPIDVFKNEKELKECGLAVPQCTELVHRLAENGFDIKSECIDVERCADIIFEALKK